MQSRLAIGGLVAVLVLLSGTPLAAQADRRDRRLPMAPNRPTGEAVSPFLEGWYANPDGTYTFSLGYFNFNTEETLEIPLGPNNFIEPAEFDGNQPTSFPGLTGGAQRRSRGYNRHERGVFTVTVPAEYGDGRESIVWTLRVHEETHTLEAHIGANPLQLDYGPRAMGSVPPLLAFEEEGSQGQHPTGITLEETLATSVGRPLTMTVWVRDPSERLREALAELYEEVPLRLTWFTHQGPVGADVVFNRVGEPWRMPDEGGESEDEDRLEPYQDRVAPSGGQSNVTATFSEPGDYVLRVRADNWSAHDSSAGDQCCWTNGYVNVRVAR